MTFDETPALVERRRAIVVQIRALRGELSALWQDQALSLEDRAAFAWIDIHWSTIERMALRPADQIVREADSGTG